jgi:hypothetical protein
MPNLTYTFAIGPGHLAQQARWLLQSIYANTDASADDIVTYVVEDERDDIGAETLEYFEERSTVIEGEMPNPEYPLSAAHAALVAATKHSNNHYTVVLDTDTVVIDDISVYENADADLFLVPPPISTLFWTDPQQSRTAWLELYDEYDIDGPDFRVNTTVHGGETLPYFDSGVIVVRNDTDFPERWRDLSKSIHGNLPESNYYCDNVSIGLLSNEYKLETLSELYNYTQKAYINPAPDDVKVIHYNETMSLYRSLRNPSVKERLESTDIADYFSNMPRNEFRLSLLKSYIKAYELSHPHSPIGKMITRLIKFQLTFRDLISKD